MYEYFEELLFSLPRGSCAQGLCLERWRSTLLISLKTKTRNNDLSVLAYINTFL